MTTTDVAEPDTSVHHPLEPLSATELETVVGIIRADAGFVEPVVFHTVTLREPPKADVIDWDAQAPLAREAFCVLTVSGRTWEAVVSLDHESIRSLEEKPGVQPAILLEEFVNCEKAVKADPSWQEVLRRRGIQDLDKAIVDPWSAGSYGDERWPEPILGCAVAKRMLVTGDRWMASTPLWT